MKRYHWKILNREQLEIWPKLDFLASQGIYLAGGTALALQLGHRTSIDFDFYSRLRFKSADLYKQIKSVFGKTAERTLMEEAKRDYIDVAFLLRRMQLKQMFSLVEDKYSQFNRYLALRALNYFDDVEEKDSKRAIKLFDEDFSWEKAKEEIFEAVKEYQLAMLKR